MRNFLRRLGLPRKASASEIEAAVRLSMDDTSDLQSISDAEHILSDKVIRTYYERTHIQYEAIAASIHCLNSPIAIDTQQWRDRVVEFEAMPDN